MCIRDRPRVRDFRGLNQRSFDGNGNYSIGVKEQIIFPEIDYDNIDKIRGLDISITTTATNDEDALALLKAFNFPIKEKSLQEENEEPAEAEAAEAEPAEETKNKEEN